MTAKAKKPKTKDDMIKRLFERVRGDITTYGQSLISVMGEGDDPPFIYTIGNHEKNLPELLIIGIGGEQAGALMNELCEKMVAQGIGFADNSFVDLGGKFPVRVVFADQRAKTDYTIQVGQFYGTQDYSVMQVILCDQNGHYPDDPDCGEPYNRVPILRAN